MNRNRRPSVGVACAALLFGVGLVAACGSSAPPPNVGPSPNVQRVRSSAGKTVQDCGEAIESRDETQCKVQPVGECVLAALKGCRAAHGTHIYSTGEGDAVRSDWFVVERPGGACDFVSVEDRTRDLLGAKGVTEKTCASAGWTRHPRIERCEMLVPSGCRLSQ